MANTDVIIALEFIVISVLWEVHCWLLLRIRGRVIITGYKTRSDTISEQNVLKTCFVLGAYFADSDYFQVHILYFFF